MKAPRSFALACLALVMLALAARSFAQPPMGGTPDVVPLPGFSCPPAKLWDQDGATGRAVCVDCRGVQPPPEQRTLACPTSQEGATLEGRDYFCQANSWRAGPWQLIADTCRCPDDTYWDGNLCRIGGVDLCRNIPGVQNPEPPGYVRDADGNCHPVNPQCVVGGVFSSGYQWRNGAEPYWNTLMNKLDACAGGWRTAPPGFDFIRQAVDYLANRWDLGPCRGVPVAFGNVRVSCERWPEDIVSTPFQRGPFFMIQLRIWTQ